MSAERPHPGIRSTDRYRVRPGDEDVTLAVTVVRGNGTAQTFQTGLVAPVPYQVARALALLTDRAQVWYEDTL